MFLPSLSRLTFTSLLVVLIKRMYVLKPSSRSAFDSSRPHHKQHHTYRLWVNLVSGSCPHQTRKCTHPHLVTLTSTSATPIPTNTSPTHSYLQPVGEPCLWHLPASAQVLYGHRQGSAVRSRVRQGKRPPELCHRRLCQPAGLFVCVCVCVCPRALCMCIYIYIYIYVCVCMCVCVCVCIGFLFARATRQAANRTLPPTPCQPAGLCVCLCVCVCVCACVCGAARAVYVCVCVCVRACACE